MPNHRSPILRTLASVTDNFQVIAASEIDGKRLEQLQRAESEIASADQSDLASRLLLECVSLWLSVVRELSRYRGPRETRSLEHKAAQASALIRHFDDESVTRMIAAFREHESDQAASVALDAVVVLERELTNLVGGYTNGADPYLVAEDGQEVPLRPHVTIWRSRLLLLRESLTTLRLLESLRERIGPLAKQIEEQVAPILASTELARTEVAAAGHELDEVRAALQEARAERARGELSVEFKNLAEREHRTSWWLRTASLVTAAAAVVAAALSSNESSWPSVVSHLVIATLIGGASAYVARLASGHRAMGDWANAVRAQLNTVQDFLNVMPSEDARTRVYEEFGRRVLGAPPINGRETVDEPGAMPLPQLIELANAIAAAKK
jgi:hypothetical protein